ncbi:dihydroxyacetone kinase family protein [Leifsonia aquatica]|uniref:dihydroxyacetone kinase family protein n=1 Tax=Leifsonia aquatica TaxID=144185 RepID=UPI0004681A0A|nr:dihydroxyacetone kinase family protein [Leifsonia aquatica]
MNSALTSADRFVDEMTSGFIAAHYSMVRRTTGGILRRRPAPHGEVALVVGGGSGHYPAFAGLVGEGLAHGAALGDVFASPSARQVAAVARAAHVDGGVLLSYGNYAGDVLNFEAAADQLRSEGIPCITVAVTDDICSAPPERRQERRGIAGDLPVFLLAAAAAERGGSLEEVARLTRHANDRVRSIGVAFSGCSLPGATEPLFHVPAGKMALGLGIHGEPGIDLVNSPDASELATMLVDRLLAEAPPDSGMRAVPFLNGLGAFKAEELFVVYSAVSAKLRNAGVGIVDPQIGEFCTSFDMRGLSLTLLWLDDELEDLWQHPVNAPAFRRGNPSRRGGDALPETFEPLGEAMTEATTPGDQESVVCANMVAATMAAIARVIDANADDLGRIDAIAGDGDHGIGMRRGSIAASEAATRAVAEGAGAGSTLTAAAHAWSDRAGGTSGILWGAILESIGVAVTDHGIPDTRTVARGVRNACERVMRQGGARPGDKTMVDALVPFTEELNARVEAGDELAQAWRLAAERATLAAAATAELTPRKGRARTHGQRAVGTPDAGAHSFALIVSAVGGTLAEHLPICPEGEPR